MPETGSCLQQPLSGVRKTGVSESEVSRCGISRTSAECAGGRTSVEWRGARFGIVALAVGALTASVLEAQEVSRERNASTEEGAPPDVLVGMRGELVGLFSPGANLDVVVGFPNSAAWASMGSWPR